MSDQALASKQDRLRSAAWQRWFAQDYSWAGLKKKEWTEDQTLQAYWLAGRSEDALRQAGELIEVEGQKPYHLVHLPLHYKDGTPTLKTTNPEAAQARLDAIVRARLDTAVPNAEDDDILHGLKQARFDGAVFLALNLSAHNYQKPLNACFSHAQFTGNADFKSATFWGMAEFLMATFTGKADFQSATFMASASFLLATFTGKAKFQSATFSGWADFTLAKFTGEAKFQSSTFSGWTYFDRATFSGWPDFTQCFCAYHVHFKHAVFENSLDLSDSVFIGDVDFLGDGAAHLRRDEPQILRLERPQSRKAPETDRSESLKGTLSPQSLIRDNAKRAIPSIKATGAIFLGAVNFANRDIPSPSRFDFARFHGPVEFHGDRLHPDVTFYQCEFEPSLAGFPDPNRLPEIPETALERLFEAHKRTNPTADKDVWIKKIKADRKERAEKAVNKKIEQSGKILEERQKARGHQHPNITEADKRRHVRDHYYSRLESAFRTLKLIMEERRDRTKEGEFFRLEIQARRKRRDVPLWERLASDLYALLSDYGNSIARPVFCLLVLMGVSGLGAYMLDGWLGLGKHQPWPLILPISQIPMVGADLRDLSVILPDLSSARFNGDSLFSALSFSLGNTAHPLSALSVDNVPDDSVAKRLLSCYGEGWGFLTRFLAAGQSVLSIILIFLTGLSVRRRFQIN